MSINYLKDVLLFFRVAVLLLHKYNGLPVKGLLEPERQHCSTFALQHLISKSSPGVGIA